jgi:hypothetical protein
MTYQADPADYPATGDKIFRVQDFVYQSRPGP